MMHFLKNIDWPSAVLICLSVISAIFTFILAKLSLQDNRKNFLGISAIDLKKMAAYSTLIFAFLTLFIQTRQQNIENEKKNAKERFTDSLQRSNLDRTLNSIKLTLIAQKKTQDSTEKILTRQKQELDNQIKILDQEKLAIKNYSEILKEQYSISKDVISSIEIASENLKAQEKSKVVLEQASQGISNINYPIAKSLFVRAKYRIYVKGFNSIYFDENRETHTIIKKLQFYKNFIKKNIGKLSDEDTKKLELFLASVTYLPLGSSMFLNSKISDIKYADQSFGVEYFTSGPNEDLNYNPLEEYFEGTKVFFSGDVISNSNRVNNFFPFINQSDLYLRINYCCDRRTVIHIKSRLCELNITKVVLADVIDVYYGNGIGNQNMLKTYYSLVSPEDKERILRQVWSQTNESDYWKVDIIKIPIVSSY